MYSENTLSETRKSIGTFLKDPRIKKALHVGDKNFDSSGVEEHMQIDIMQSVAPWISTLLDHYRVLFYNGQLDVIIGYPLTENFLKNLKFKGDKEYKTANRQTWYVSNNLAGYVKKAGNLTEVMVRNAGHLVPEDQPEWSYDLISKFVENRL